MSVRRQHFFLATCDGCQLPMPFAERDERDRWAEDHGAATGHSVRRSSEWRDLSVPLAEDHDRHSRPELAAEPAAEPATEAAEEALLCVGGPRHGQQVNVEPGAEAWFDIEHAQSYRRQPYLAGEDQPLLGTPMAMWSRDALLWEGIGDGNQAVMLLSNWLYGQWVKQSGRRVRATFNAPPPQPSNGGTSS